MIDKKTIGSGIGAAAGTAAAGPIGTAIGAAAGGAIAGLLGGGGSSWSSAGPGVHQWFTDHGEEAFLAWMRKNHPGAFGNLETVKALRYTWTFTGPDNGGINNLRNPIYQLSPAAELELWRTLGVDIGATVAAAQAAGANVNNIPASLVVKGAPSPATVDELQRIKNKADSGQPLTPSERKALEALKRGAGEGVDLGSIFMIAGVVVLIYVATR